MGEAVKLEDPGDGFEVEFGREIGNGEVFVVEAAV
jgi:hypothetical protein